MEYFSFPLYLSIPLFNLLDVKLVRDWIYVGMVDWTVKHNLDRQTDNQSINQSTNQSID